MKLIRYIRSYMARKLRLEKGDYVTLKISYGKGFMVGRVVKRYLLNEDERKQYGVYGYLIQWFDGDEKTNSGWTISDILTGRLKYLKDRTTLDILYGRKDIQEGS